MLQPTHTHTQNVKHYENECKMKEMLFSIRKLKTGKQRSKRKQDSGYWGMEK